MAEFKFNCPRCWQAIEADESLRGQVAECPHCRQAIVVPRVVPKENTPTQGYVCTHCGEVTASLKKIHGEILGCFYFIVGIPLMGFLLFLGALPPMALILGAAIFLILGIISLAQGERTKCGNCGKFNTMISVTSPQGRRLLKETGPSHGMMYSPPPPLVQPQQQDVSERLSKMQKLLDGGLISTEEYEIQRKRILESI